MIDEFEFISKYLSPIAKKFPESKELLDDAALLPFENKQLVISVDNFIVGLHCPLDMDADLVATRAILVAASDLAAMASEPNYLLISLSIPKKYKRNEKFLGKLSKGIKIGAKLSNLALVGGDTIVYDGPLALCVTVIGKVNKGKELFRKGASPGDVLAVTGNIGDGLIGLEIMQGKHKKLSVKDKKYFSNKFLKPNPQYSIALNLSNIASSCIDISDGLNADSAHIANSSKCGLFIENNKIPISPFLIDLINNGKKKIEDIANHGDDYQLAFAIPNNKIDKALNVAKKTNTKLTIIGEFLEQRSVVSKNKNFKKGFKHF